MENIFTPEEANKSVTYGELAVIIQMVADEFAKASISDVDNLQENTFKIIDKLTDSLVQIRDDADYKRQRDLRFMINLISQMGHYDKDILYSEYQRWCEEFDKINKPKSDLESNND